MKGETVASRLQRRSGVFEKILVVCALGLLPIVTCSASPPADLNATINELRKMAVERNGTNRVYAARRLAALARIGAIAPTDDVLLKSHRNLLTEQIKQGHLIDAGATLADLAEFDGEGILWHLHRMALLGASGRLDLTDVEYDELGRYVPGDHSLPEIRSYLQKIQILLRRMPKDEDHDGVPLRERLVMWVEAVERGMAPQDAAPISSMIQDAAREMTLLDDTADPGLMRAYWLVLDAALRRPGTNDIASLRASQDIAAAPEIKAAHKRRDPMALLQVWRRFPWAVGANRALMTYGTGKLREGHLAAAAMCFQDVIDHSSDEALLASARTGLSLCAAPPGLASSAETAMWAGSGPVRVQLPSACTHHPALLYARDLGDDWLQMRWPMTTLQFSGDFVLAGAPAFLACYKLGDTKTPLWKHILEAPWLTTGRDEDVIMPDVAYPAVDASRVYARWGRRTASGDRRFDLMVGGRAVPASRLRRQHTGYAAFDLQSGRPLWSTAGQPYWKDMIAVGDPIVDEHNIYMTGTAGDMHSLNSDRLEFVVICADKADGSLRWKQNAGWIRPYVKSKAPGGRSWMPGFNARLTIGEGKLYTVAGNGLIACQDIRDGMPLWIRDERGFNPVPGDIEAYVQRPNHFALLYKDSLIVAPRDRPGVAVIDRQSGKRIWDKPWLPSATLALLPRDRLLLQDAQNLFVVNLDDGSTAWQRSFSEILRGPAQVDESGIHVIVGERLQRLDAITGRTLNQSPALEKGLASSFARHQGETFYASYADEAGDEPGLTDRSHFVDTGGGAHLKRWVPRLFVPDEDSPLAERIYLVAEGFIECLDARRTRPHWRRSIRPDFMKPIFVGNDVLLAGRRRVVVVDGLTGATRWQVAIPRSEGALESVESWHMADDLCVGVGKVAMISFDPKTGRPVYSGPLPKFIKRLQVGVSGNTLCLVGEQRDPDDNNKRTVDVVRIRPRDGQALARYKLPVKSDITAAFRDNAVWIIGSNRHVYHIDSASGTVTRSRLPMLSDADAKLRGPHEKIRASVYGTDGDYALLDGVLTKVMRRWLFKADGSAATPGGTRNFLLGEGLLCEARNRRLRIVDMASGKQRYVCTIPVGNEVVHVRREDGIFRVVSAKQPPSRAASPVNTHHYRVDLFDDRDGSRIRGRALPGIRPTSWKLRDTRKSWANEFAWLGDMLFITDAFGLHAVPMDAASYEKLETSQVLIFRTTGALVLDGSASEEDGLDPVTPTASVEESHAKCYVSHDGRYLYIAVSYVNPDPNAIMERGRLVSTGDRLEMELRTNLKPDEDKPWQTYKWNVGLSRDGHSVFTRDAPAGIRGVVAYDLASKVWTAEMVIPLKSIQNETHPRQADMRLSIAVRDDAYGDTPAARWHRLALRLHTMTREEETAGLAIASRLPALNESQWFVKKLLEAHVTDWPIGRSYVGDLLRQNDNTAFAAWLLRYLDKRIETRSGLRALEDLRALAVASGVDRKLLDWYDSYPTDREKDPTKVMPGTDNTVMPETDAISHDDLMALFKTYIPPLGPTETANRFFSALVRELHASPEEEISLVTWYLKTFPRHPRIRNFLEGVWEVARKENEDTAVDRVEKVLEESGIAAVEKYRFRRTSTHTGHARVRDWHFVGPFPSILIEQELGDTILPKHQGRITLKEHYRLTDRRLRWKHHHADSGVVDMRTLIAQPFVKAMGYAVAWVKPPVAGKAILEVGSFGPCSVWINNRLVYHSVKDSDDAWLPKGYTSKGRFPVRAVPVLLPANWSMVLVENTMEKRGWQFGLEFVNAEGKGPLRGVQVMRPEGPGLVIAEAVPRPPIPAGGLRGEYYDDRELTALKVVRKDPTIDFSWVLESPDPRIDWDEFSVRWTGRIIPRYTEPYTFILRANDGVRFWLDGKLLIDHWSYHGGRSDHARVVLYENRPHHIRLEHYELTDHANMHMWWESASQAREIVPAERLSSSWYLDDTIIAPPDPSSPVGVPRFYSIRISPRELWLPTGTQYSFKAVPVNQYGEAIDPASHFDDKGNPIDTSVKWKVIPGGRINLMQQYGGAAYLPHKNQKARGVIDKHGVFISDGSRGIVTVIAESVANPGIRGIANMAVDDLPGIGPFTGRPLTIGSGFSGDIDRCRVYTKALSAAQIKKHSAGEKLSNIGLLADWSFDEIVDGKFPNSAGEGLDAVVAAQSVRHMKDEDGAYLRFDRGRVEVADDPRLNFSQQATLEAWVRPEGRGGLVLDRCRWGTVQGFRLEVHSAGGLRCQGNFGHGGLEVGAKLSPFVWNHIVAIYGKSGLRQLWANGELVGERKGGPQVMEW